MKAVAIIDCNNFYASCQRVFDARLRGRPVVISLPSGRIKLPAAVAHCAVPESGGRLGG